MFTTNNSRAFFAIVPGAAIGVLAVALGVRLANDDHAYGLWLFVAAPLAMGAATAFVYNLGRDLPTGPTMRMVVVTTATAGGVLLLWSLEGLVCLAMALPLAVPLALLGGVVGRTCSRADMPRYPPAMLMLLALPATAAVEPPIGHTLHEVQSSVIIEAPPGDVWPHVVAFSELPPPTDWVFRTGIAYPIRARIEGTGVGAVRYCEFSTGAFVEPITGWEPGVRLSFDVVEQPASMRELSPFGEISPRHLLGYLRSKRGEFRFVDLGDGRTRLEGSTWYELEFAPESYWRIFSDALIHRIHRRVLDHIKSEVEGHSTGAASSM